ncbi:MAG: hypothetical protein CMI16_02925 [Opitutaceae bacterium]|nr:hypothetical protein [Opitutaceae bacterium]
MNLAYVEEIPVLAALREQLRQNVYDGYVLGSRVEPDVAARELLCEVGHGALVRNVEPRQACQQISGRRRLPLGVGVVGVTVELHRGVEHFRTRLGREKRVQHRHARQHHAVRRVAHPRVERVRALYFLRAVEHLQRGEGPLVRRFEGMGGYRAQEIEDFFVCPHRFGGFQNESVFFGRRG